MSLEELGSIGELISSIAVVISLVYLAIQLRSSTDTARTSTYQAVVAEFGALNRAMASTKNLSAMFAAALEDYDALDTSDRETISQLLLVAFQNFENMYYQYRKGYLEDDVWIGWKRLMLTYHSRPGFQAWWKMRRDVFSPSFVEFLATEVLDRSIPSYWGVSEKR
ncbi:MAG: hypothetical protein ACR2I8_01605 [Steroidobacteraceae bacterium]